MRRRRFPTGLLAFTPLSGLFGLGILWLTMTALDSEAASPSPSPSSVPVSIAAQGTELVSNDGTYRLRYTSDPATIPWGERFSIDVRVERTDGEALVAELSLDARMPEHGHGMNREPKLERRADGSWRVTNLLFHMPGYWEVYFDLTRGAITERAQFSVELD